MRDVEFAKFQSNSNGAYSYVYSNSQEMNIISGFLTAECGTNFFLQGYKKGILDENWDGNKGIITMIEKEDRYIYLSDLYSDEDDKYVKIKIPVEQLIKIMDEWQVIINLEKKPKEIILKRKNNQFIFETYD